MTEKVYPIRKRVGRSGRKGRAVVSGFTWLPPDQVPGAILSASAERALQEKLDEIRRCQIRAMAGARNYVIY